MERFFNYGASASSSGAESAGGYQPRATPWVAGANECTASCRGAGILRAVGAGKRPSFREVFPREKLSNIDLCDNFLLSAATCLFRLKG